MEQLRDDGVLVLPLWLRAGIQVSVAFRKDGSRLRNGRIVPCGFVRKLLEQPSRSESLSEPPPGWFERLALDEDVATPISLFEEGGWLDRRGLLDAGSKSLALAAPSALLVHGSATAAEMLRERLARARSLDITRTSITAVPTGSVGGDEIAEWRLERPSFTFLIREPEGRG